MKPKFFVGQEVVVSGWRKGYENRSGVIRGVMFEGCWFYQVQFSKSQEKAHKGYPAIADWVEEQCLIQGIDLESHLGCALRQCSLMDVIDTLSHLVFEHEIGFEQVDNTQLWALDQVVFYLEKAYEAADKARESVTAPRVLAEPQEMLAA